MLFHSIPFVILLLFTLVLYYQQWMRKAQPLLLVAASLVFYGYHEPWLLLLLLGSIAINAIASQGTRHVQLRVARAWLVAGVCGNLSLLLLFKYGPLLASSVLDDAEGKGTLGHFLLTLPLPIGISFFTFQGMSLLVDSFRSRDREELLEHLQGNLAQRWLSVTLYISFFPQLVAGPIVKAHEFLPQIRPKTLQSISWDQCFRHLVLGYFLKMCVADNLKDYTFWIDPKWFPALSSLDLILLLFGFSMQIFADFAGYSLIALGIGGLFGYRLPINFRNPYLAQSFAEFWRRWHISLSSWLRDYLYLPLGGSRQGKARTYRNLLVVMFLGGLWHGAAWSYAVWGLVHGIALAVERVLGGANRRSRSAAGRTLHTLAVFSFVTLAWLLFKLPNFTDAVEYLQCIGTNLDRQSRDPNLFFVPLYSLPVVLLHLAELHPLRGSRPRSLQFEVAAYSMMVFLLLVNAGDATEFIYFQF